MTNSQPKIITVYCGELCKSSKCNSTEINLLNYDNHGLSQNITVNLSQFVINPHSLSERMIDLLQLAAYVFCADRLANRGERNSVENTSWARTFEYHIPVCDLEFWNSPQVKATLSEVLQFMTGDRRHSFFFEKAERISMEDERSQLSMFDTEYVTLDDAKNTDVMLFSGGLDSLAGAIERLNTTNHNLCLVTHKSNRVVSHTQDVLIKHMVEKYGRRIIRYGFECHNRQGTPSREETQRTRMFLFTAIAFAICFCYKKKELYIYENGMTSLNFPKQMDVFNARASRTTHPKTIGLLRKFCRLMEPEFNIVTPFCRMTKEDVLSIFARFEEKAIIASAVSCSSSRNRPSDMPHCGCCSQCIDRIFAIHAAGLQDYDAPYAEDIVTHIPNNEVLQRVYHTMRMATSERIKDISEFYQEYPTEIMDILDFWPLDNPEDAIQEVFELYNRFGDSIIRASKNIAFRYDNLSEMPFKPSLLSVLSDRSYLQSPILMRVSEIDQILKHSIPLSFQRNRPESENAFNDMVQGVLTTHGKFTREFPIIQFGLTAYKADHSNGDLIVESKYLRGNTTPSVAIRGITTDIVQIPTEYGIMFVIYDPDRSIKDDDEFISALQKYRDNCYVKIYR